MTKLRVIDGSKENRKASPEMVTCPECNGTSFLPARSQVIKTEHGYSGGVDELVCLLCLTNGKLTIV